MYRFVPIQNRVECVTLGVDAYLQCVCTCARENSGTCVCVAFNKDMVRTVQTSLVTSSCYGDLLAGGRFFLLVYTTQV